MKPIILSLALITMPAAGLSFNPEPMQVVIGGRFVSPVGPVAVAPGQPEVGTAAAATPDTSGMRTASPTAGIINAICSVTLNVVGCPFIPNSASLSCDTDGDGVFDLVIPLTNITVVNPLLVRVTVPAGSQLRGTPFPLACCGGIARLTLTRAIEPFTQTVKTDIDLGPRAPVVISVTPSTGSCSTGQNLLISGACFIDVNGNSAVTSVFAVERNNASNVIQARSFVILSDHLVDADFELDAANAGKSFLFFVSGPNGTSRNLTSLPMGAGTNCPLGNEAGIQVLFNCTAPPAGQSDVAIVTGTLLERTAAGGVLLTVTGLNIQDGAAVTINGRAPRKIKFKQLDVETGTFRSVQIKGSVCGMIPGMIVITNPGKKPTEPIACNLTCDQ
ncbi:MAG TPA: IPT/TIG domain-containing protein [Blastocatellia bacterium]|nr:IPT/TIG domain-containing protein [Blastocatellia bacterium]